MGMPITVEIIDQSRKDDFKEIFNYFRKIDRKYSPYKADSELAKVNDGLPFKKWSSQFKKIIELCDMTNKQTFGYFNIKNNDKLDPSGLVKGWAIYNAANILLSKGYKNFFIEAGGDIQVYGNYESNKPWQIGIRNPFNIQEIIKILAIKNKGVATSGTYIRGGHIYNPHQENQVVDEIKSITVIGPNIYEADRFATAAFAMGKNGIAFIEGLSGFEGYMISNNKIATYTSGFENYVAATD